MYLFGSSIKFEVENHLLAVVNCPEFRVLRNLVLMFKRSSRTPELVKEFIEFISEYALLNDSGHCLTENTLSDKHLLLQWSNVP
jgi:hypothetical protein